MREKVIQALAACPLYFILDGSLCTDSAPLDVGRAALEAGVRMIQLRIKDLSGTELAGIARELKALPAEPGWLLIVNDSVEAALASGADGVHLGEHDTPVAEARRAGADLIIGATARTPEAAMNAEAAGADYLGCGSVYPSLTKPGLPVIGTEGIAEVCRILGIPVVGIGGIDSSNARDVVEAGAAGFCAVAPFAAGAGIEDTARDMLAAVSGIDTGVADGA